jgi:minor curlin subunit
MKQTFSCAVAGMAVFLTLAAQAQQRMPSEAATSEQRLAEDIGVDRLPTALGDVRNTSVLIQSGTGNASRLNQQSLSSPENQAYLEQAGSSNAVGMTQIGGGNRVFILQNGANNTAGFTQKGQGNTTTISQQGANNKLSSTTGSDDFVLEGDRNALKISQIGANNTVKGEVRESDRTYDIRQYGSNNTLTQIETSSQTPKGYSIEMRGQGINLTIEQSKVLPGVK